MTKDFHKFAKLSDTRWLVRYKAVKIIREQYFESEKFFREVVKTDIDYGIRNLLPISEDHILITYFFLIVEPILLEINGVNLYFQKDNVNVDCAYDDMKDLIMLLASKVLKPEFRTTDLEKVSTFAQKQACYLSIDSCNNGVSYYAGLLELKVTNEKKKL